MDIRSHFYPFLKLIPKGKVVTYGFLAKIFATHPRAIARLLAVNKKPNEYPCFRVLASNGGVSGFAFGIEDKLRRLEEDGIIVTNGRVAGAYVWEPQLFNMFVAYPITGEAKRNFSLFISGLKKLLMSSSITLQNPETSHVMLAYFEGIDFGTHRDLVVKIEKHINAYASFDSLRVPNFSDFDHRIFTLVPENPVHIQKYFANFSGILNYHPKILSYNPHATVFRTKQDIDPEVYEKIQDLARAHPVSVDLSRLRIYVGLDEWRQVPVIDIPLGTRP